VNNLLKSAGNLEIIDMVVFAIILVMMLSTGQAADIGPMHFRLAIST